MRFALKVCYNGRGFSGSQRQPGERTVEGEFLSALHRLGLSFTEFKAAGRTDRGVSALGNVFALTTDSERIKPRMVNAALPRDIKVTAAQRVGDDFNPRHARERIYRYFLFDEGYDLAKMRRAAALFKGERSFHNFSSSDYRNPLRRINRVEIHKKDDVIVMEVSGESFLWQMIRRMATALKMAGTGEATPQDVERLLDPDYKKKIPPSDPENLILWDVKYDFNFEDEEYTKKRLIGELEKQWKKTRINAAILAEALENQKTGKNARSQ
ncbi:MAG: tRNA pseudouridine(38-40) synthase TruA [Methanobacteriota archaeon]|nr:MAG: tRNA pseudouridine(38-40) synthase TruA [Euryarchaeota archaeon]